MLRLDEIKRREGKILEEGVRVEAVIGGHSDGRAEGDVDLRRQSRQKVNKADQREHRKDLSGRRELGETAETRPVIWKDEAKRVGRERVMPRA